MSLSPRRSDPAAPPRQFAATRWSLVLNARSSDDGADALAELCRAYWLPLFGYLRGRGYDPHSAEDLVQGFFEEVLEQQTFSKADPARGQFRSFLLSCLHHYVARQHQREARAKRGGGQRFLPLDVNAEEAEARYVRELADTSGSPEQHFDRLWALTLLDRALQRLKSQHEGGAAAQRFAVLQPFLVGSRGDVPLDEAAEKLNLTPQAVKSAVFRLRQRFSEIVREELRELVESDADVQDELRYLLGCIS
jgi:RNA polymerase sigma factor (sigma-70 family)